MAQTKIKAGLFEGIIGNGTDGYFLMSNGDGTMTWSSLVINPTVTSIAYPGSVTAADPAGGETITVTGTGFKTGATVTIGGTAAPAVSYVSATQITFTTPAKAAGDYDIVVTNTDTGSATYINGISYNGIPTWTTAAGSLGTFASDTTISTITLQASEPDSGTITFSITNGALPTGLSLTGADIDGTTTLETADTLYTFTVTATDDETQTTPRTFTITVTKQFINTDNFTINTFTGNGSTQSIEGKIGTAASFNGSSSYIDLGSTVDDPLRTAGEFGVSLWFNADSYGTNPVIFKLLNDTYVYIFLNGSNQLECRVVDSSDTSRVVTTSVSLNTWYHVVWTGDSTNGVTLYLNGSSVGNTSWNGTFLTYTNSSYKFNYLGYNGSNTGWYTGKIDQVRIFDKAISSSEVTTLYGESNTSTTKSTTDIFDDGSGVALYEFEGGAKDTGGVTGYIGAGGLFNGSSSGIILPNNIFDNNLSHSFSFWVFFNDATPSSEQQIFFGGETNLRLQTNGELRFRRWTGSGNDIDSSAVNQNQWYHIVCTYDASSGMAFYINGTSVGTNSSTTNVLTSATKSLGYRGDNNSSYFNGKLDQVRIFDKALSSSEVTTLYGETSASATKSTTDIFSDSSGIALYELEGNANDTGGVTGRTNGTEAAVFTNAANSSLNLGNARVVNNSFGVSFWVKMNKISQSENVYLCSFMYGSNTSLYMDTNNVLQVSNGGYSRNESFSTTHTFAVDTWYHIVYTGQIAGDSTLRCYVNGTQVGSRGWISGHNYTVTSGNTIGSYNNADNSIDGNIADFRIYKSTYLSASDVTALYSGTPPTTGLTEFYSFNGNDTDAQGNRTLTASNVIYNYNGTATNVLYAYDGTPTNVSFLGMAFQPDLVWVKVRDASTSHALIDSVRGRSSVIYSNITSGEATSSASNDIVSFDSNGFTLGADQQANANTNGNDIVAWCWKAASSDSTNTDGTITSTVRANQGAGFSIVTYSGNSASSATIGHGLSSAPELIITKARNLAAGWPTMIKTSSTSLYGLRLNDSGANDAANGSGFYNNTAPTNSLYTVGGSDEVNDGYNYVSYCFHSVDGYQKIGSYSGSNSPITVTTGFKPRFLMVKRTDTTGSWIIIDSAREIGSGADALFPDLSAAESSDWNTDFISTGFTISSNEAWLSASGGTYIYLAIA